MKIICCVLLSAVLMTGAGCTFDSQTTDIDAAVAPEKEQTTILDMQYSGSTRGPLRIEAHIKDADLDSQFILMASVNGHSSPATLFTIATQQQLDDDGLAHWTWVWDSFADYESDVGVLLQVAAETAPQTPLNEGLLVPLQNDPDNMRLVLACHPSAQLPEGGVSDVNNQVSVLYLNSDASLVDSGLDLQVGTGPAAVVFSPDASLAVVRNGHDANLSILDIDLNSAQVSVRPGVLDFSPYSVFDQRFSPDGQNLYVLAGRGSENILLELAPGNEPFVELRRRQMNSVAQCLAISPRGDFLAIGRSGDDGHRILEIYERKDLQVIASLSYSATLCDRLRFSADGQWLVSSDSLSSHQLSLFQFDGVDTLQLVDEINDLAAVAEGIFHPDSHALLVSTLNGNSLQLYGFSLDSGLVLQDSLTGGLPLAAEMDVVRRGQRRGQALVSTLSAVASIDVQDNEQLSMLEFLSTGDGIAFMVQGLAIQP